MLIPNAFALVSYEGNIVKIYKDGILNESSTITASPRTGIAYIGGVDSPNYAAQIWDGDIDDVRVYNRVLSAAEIKALYNLGN